MRSILNSKRFWIITAAILVTAISRFLLIGIPNAAPIAAIALFGGAYLMDKRMAFIIPLLAMFMSDVLLQVTYKMGMQPYVGFHATMPVIYGCFILTVIIGIYLRNRIKPLPIVGAALLSSVIFFLTTNFAIWARGVTFPMNITGLLLCYEVALPFFKNTLVSNLAFTAVLFGGFEVIKSRIPEPAG